MAKENSVSAKASAAAAAKSGIGGGENQRVAKMKSMRS